MGTFKFMEDRGGQLKIHSTISKKARGAFLTALIENQVQTVEEARRLSFAGFNYREDLSQPQELVFVKEVQKSDKRKVSRNMLTFLAYKVLDK